ncbi:MAG: diguanylate cyclase [Pusillimonas sp.]
MPLRRTRRLDLRRLIVTLAVITGIIMLVNSFYASYKAQERALIDSRLQLNHAYASKVAAATGDYLQNAMQQLRYSSKELSKVIDIPHSLQAEARRLFEQTENFDSVVVVDASGKVLTSSPTNPELDGKVLNTPGVVEAIARKGPTISEPYISSTGNLIIVLSQPIFAATGEYLGYVGGSIYLQRNHILDRLLGNHHYRDGSYLYVVDQRRTLVYHPDRGRQGTIVGSNTIVDAVLEGETGHMMAPDSAGTVMLAGYAPIAMTGWGVVAQCPTEVALTPLGALMIGVLKDTAIPAIIILGLAWWLARLISRPLTALAEGARELDLPHTAQKIEEVESWYFEASQLKNAMLEGMNTFHHKIVKLNLDAQTDALTGLLNRRGQEMALEALEQSAQDFCVVAIDIDHFKQVNDTWGHDTGDLVLQQLATAMRVCSRDEDLLCRSGGEEFLMLLPATPPGGGQHVAGRLRSYVDNLHDLPGPGHITISLGVAYWSPNLGTTVEYTLKAADDALYQAKRNGRNRIELATGTNPLQP